MITPPGAAEGVRHFQLGTVHQPVAQRLRGAASEGSSTCESVTETGIGASSKVLQQFAWPAARFGGPKFTGMKPTGLGGNTGRLNGSWTDDHES